MTAPPIVNGHLLCGNLVRNLPTCRPFLRAVVRHHYDKQQGEKDNLEYDLLCSEGFVSRETITTALLVQLKSTV